MVVYVFFFPLGFPNILFSLFGGVLFSFHGLQTLSLRDRGRCVSRDLQLWILSLVAKRSFFWAYESAVLCRFSADK